MLLLDKMKKQRGTKIKSMVRLNIHTEEDMDSFYDEGDAGEDQPLQDSTKTKVLFSIIRDPWYCFLVALLLLPTVIHAEGSTWERPLNMPRILGLEVMCGAQHMEVHLSFDSPFQGLVASKGMYGHPNCIYVHPRSGQTNYVFNINYEQCGTKPDNHGKFYENTVVVQYDEELIEAWDEAKRLRCEWFNDYEKTATKTSPMVISDLDIVELNFHGDNVDCWMEIQEGKGPWAPPLTGIVPLGSPLTMVIAVKDPTGEFDMRVKACEASDGQNGHVLPLSDVEGCILRPKLIGKFSKIKLDDGRATVLTYAFLSAFKFPDMLNVHMRCTVEICRHGCPDHCSPHSILAAGSENSPQKTGAKNPQDSAGYESKVNEVKSNEIPRVTPKAYPLGDNTPRPAQPSDNPVPAAVIDSIREHIHQQEKLPQQQQEGPQQHPPPPPPYQGGPGPVFPPNSPQLPPPPHPPHMYAPIRNGPPPPPQGRPLPYFPPGQQQRFPVHSNRYPPPPPGRHPMRNGPHPGPMPPPGFLAPPPPPMQHGHPPPQNQRIHHRVDTEKTIPEDIALPRLGEAAVDDSEELSRGLNDNKPETQPEPTPEPLKPQAEHLKGEPSSTSDPFELPVEVPVFPKGPRKLRFRRSVASNKGVIGIEGQFKVVSEADLNFALNSSTSGQSATVILNGAPMLRNRDTIYGICLPRFGFGIVFFGLGLATLVAILTAVFLAYAHYVIKTSNRKSREGGCPPSVHSYTRQENVLPMVILRKMW